MKTTKTTTTAKSVKLPDSIWQELREVDAREKRPLNMFIRENLETLLKSKTA